VAITPAFPRRQCSSAWIYEVEFCENMVHDVVPFLRHVFFSQVEDFTDAYRVNMLLTDQVTDLCGQVFLGMPRFFIL
jgi:hypothetical protein